MEAKSFRYTLKALLKDHPLEQAEESSFTSSASESVCAYCSGTGWQPAKGDDLRYRRCECVRRRVIAERLSVIPVRFRSATFQSYQAQSPQQESERLHSAIVCRMDVMCKGVQI